MEWYKNKEILEELDRRTTDYESSKVKGIPWEEAKNDILSTKVNKLKKDINTSKNNEDNNFNTH
ncbi:MAG: hypothetical protein JWQ38_761 [Flavipsychrobacter sp.]|nr:hypothetical protein [Flavipsychrobacter sp.]